MGLFSRKSKEPKPEEKAQPEATSDEGVHLSVEELKLEGDADGLIDALLRGDDPQRRIDAAWALVEMKEPRTVETLIGLVKDSGEPSGLRFQAIGALGKMQAKDAVDSLIGVLVNDDEEAQVQAGAAVSLGWIGEPRAAEPLAEMWLKARDDTLRDAAGNAFKELDVGTSDVLLSALSDPQRSADAAARLGEFADESAIPQLRQAVERAQAGQEKDTAKAAEEAIKAIQERTAA